MSCADGEAKERGCSRGVSKVGYRPFTYDPFESLEDTGVTESAEADVQSYDNLGGLSHELCAGGRMTFLRSLGNFVPEPVTLQQQTVFLLVLR